MKMKMYKYVYMQFTNDRDRWLLTYNIVKN